MDTIKRVDKDRSAKSSPVYYQGLDFLRGAAALCVVMFHCSSRLDMGGLMAHGYLAVDFFFVLSGFVIDRAYGGRLASRQLSFREFFLIRIVRLWPMVLLGTALAAIIDLGRQGDFSIGEHVFDIVTATVLGGLLLPTFWPTTLEQTTYPLNGPAWSLFFELFVNFVAAQIYLSRRRLELFALIALVSLAVLVWRSGQSYDVHLGTHSDTFFFGFARVSWSFCVGMMVSRFDSRAPALSKWFYALALAALLASPRFADDINRIFDLTAIVVLFPLIVLGAVHCTGANERSALSEWSGAISYPVYAVHYPLVRVVGVIGRQLNLVAAGNFLIGIIATAAIALFGAFVFRAFDRPARRLLSRWIARAGN